MKTLAAIGGAALMALSVGAPASAQDQPVEGAGPSTGSVMDRNTPTRGDASRLQAQSNEGRGRNRARERAAAPVLPTPEESLAAAQAIATTGAPSCQVTSANYLGDTAEGAKSYEAACAVGPGYILIGSTPPQAVDCVLLAGQAEIDRARDPAADVGTQCLIPQNTDVIRVLSAYATEAGVHCTVDQGASIGKSTEGNLIYEIGCNGVDGYWIERTGSTWKVTECAIVTTQNAVCRYSTPEEKTATFKTRLTGSEAASCDPTDVRYMGANANGAFWEAKCAAGNGLIVRFNTEYAVQQVYPCETAQRIGGGCRLTIVPDLPAAEAPPAQQ